MSGRKLTPKKEQQLQGKPTSRVEHTQTNIFVAALTKLQEKKEASQKF